MAKTFCLVMVGVEDFLKAPSEEVLERCSREQLVKTAEHFGTDVGDKRMNENIKSILKANLFEDGVFKVMVLPVGSVPGIASVNPGLTFVQQKELLLLQLEQSRLQQQTEREKWAVKKLKHEAELKSLEVEQYKRV